MNMYEVKTKDDIKVLMDSFAYFHDSCIKELKYYSGAYVSLDRSINPFNSIRDVSVIFQSQCAKIPTIELNFKHIQEIHLRPKSENCDAIIYCPTIFIYKNLIYWCEYDDFSIDKSAMFDGTWLSAEKLTWREVNNGLGNKEQYISLL